MLLYYTNKKLEVIKLADNNGFSLLGRKIFRLDISRCRNDVKSFLALLLQSFCYRKRNIDWLLELFLVTPP